MIHHVSDYGVAPLRPSCTLMQTDQGGTKGAALVDKLNGGALCPALAQTKSCMMDTLKTCRNSAADVCELFAAEDVYDAILRAGARLNLPIVPLAERIAGQKWDLPSPPPKASPWVDELCMHLQMFREKLRQVKGLSDSNMRQVQLALHHFKKPAPV